MAAEEKCARASAKSSEVLTVGTPTGSPASLPELEYVPDGGKEAWTVVVGSCLALVASAGMINAYGTFQDYYEKSLLWNSSASSISFIGSLQTFLLYFLGPLVGRIFDAYGSTVLIPLGSAICVLALMMVSLAQENQVYQVFLSHGVLFGIGISLLFNPSIAVLGHWFRHRRALAIGLTTGGSALGGVLLPIILGRLMPTLGFGWAVRVVAFILAGCLVVACLTIRTRLPLSRDISSRSAIDLGGFKDPRYVLATIGSFLILFVFFVPYTYIEIYAQTRGVPPQIATYLISILNAMNIPSRILPGILADRYGALNVYIVAAAVCSALSLGLWLPSRNVASIVAFTVLYGLFSGALVSLIPTYIAIISPREKYGARLGSVYMIIAIGTLVGTPTGGALLKVADEEHFAQLIIFCGVLTGAGAAVLGLAAIVGNWKRRQHLGQI
ncbi:major facilitator superfamily domain-containing protein [Trametes punicea]|nr:major facilitator superfamily domain-containing protein [Trametes punicea]